MAWTRAERGKAMPWKTLLQAHFGVIAATDFLLRRGSRGLVR
jgi:hypothetical protein